MLFRSSDAILLDVKYGDGAFMKTKADAKKLAETMITIGKSLNRDTRATLSNMNQPLGNAIGNSLEVKEAIETLNGYGPQDLLELCLEAGSHMLVQAKRTNSLDKARKMLEQTITDQTAIKKLEDMVNAQGGDSSYITNPSKVHLPKQIVKVKSRKTGYIKDLHAHTLGIVSMKLGGGREKTEDKIDYSVGIILHKKIGDYVEEGEHLLEVHTNTGLNEIGRASCRERVYVLV